MASKEDVLATYANEQYRKLQREKDQYISLENGVNPSEWTIS